MPSEVARQWFVPGEGIDRFVISADIQRYLGNDATVRPGMGTGENEGVPGYWIKAYRNLTTAMIADLRADSGRWRTEQRTTGTREPYVGSSTYHASTASRQPHRGESSPMMETRDTRDTRDSRMPDRMPDRMQDRMPDRAQDRMADRMPDRMMTDRISDRISDRMPERMSSDRMLPSGRMADPRMADPRMTDPRMADPRMTDPRMSDRMDARMADRMDTRMADRMDPRMADRMDMDPPVSRGSGFPPDRGYQDSRGQYPPEPRDSRAYGDSRAGYPSEQSGYGRVPPSVTSPYAQDSRYPTGYPSSSNDGAPPGYVRQGDYYVPISTYQSSPIGGVTRGPDPSYGAPAYGQTTQASRADYQRSQQPDYQDPRYAAYPSPAPTLSSMVSRSEISGREPVTSPSQSSPYGSSQPPYDQYTAGRPVQPSTTSQADPRFAGTATAGPSAFGRSPAGAPESRIPRDPRDARDARDARDVGDSRDPRRRRMQ